MEMTTDIEQNISGIFEDLLWITDTPFYTKIDPQIVKLKELFRKTLAEQYPQHAGTPISLEEQGYAAEPSSVKLVGNVIPCDLDGSYDVFMQDVDRPIGDGNIRVTVSIILPKEVTADLVTVNEYLESMGELSDDFIKHLFETSSKQSYNIDCSIYNMQHL
jgi:hypothetical protein